MPRGGIQELVLHLRIELVCPRLVAAIVARQGKEIAHFLVKALLGCPNVTDAGKQFIEVVGTTVWILEPRIVNREALDKILAQMRISPLSELRPAYAPNPKPNSKNHFQGIVDDIVPLAVCGSC